MSTYPPAILQCANPICITDAILSKHVTSIICYSRRTVQVIHSAPFKLFTAHCSSYSQCTVQVIHSTPFKLLTVHRSSYSQCTVQVIHSTPFKLLTAHRSSYSQRTVQVRQKFGFCCSLLSKVLYHNCRTDSGMKVSLGFGVICAWVTPKLEA